MAQIHSSHSKKELYEIIEVFDLHIISYKKFNKVNLCKSILYELSKIEEVKEDNDFFFIKNKQELLDYLINPDPSKVLTIKEKDNVMNIAKYIITYCKNNFFLSMSPFVDYDDMIKQANYISDYGDIPSVRKAIDKLNTDPKLTDKISYFVSTKTRKKLERKKRLSQQIKPSLLINKGKYIIDFS